MGVKRIGNPDFHRTKNKKGHNTWKRNATIEVVRPPAGNLAAVAEDTSAAPLPKPSPDLMRHLKETKNWSGLDLSGLDLRGLTVGSDGATVDGISFAGSDLRGLHLRGVKGTGVDFTGARTEDMVLDRGADLSDIITDGTFDLKGMVVGETRLSFRESTRLLNYGQVTPSPFGGLTTAFFVDNVDFSGDVFSSYVLDPFGNISRGDFTGATFAGAGTDRHELSAMRFDRCVFRNADMKDMVIEACDFNACEFAEANTSNWFFRVANRIEESDFTDADMRGWRIRDDGWNKLEVIRCKLSGADQSGTDPVVLRQMWHGGSDYDRYTIAQAAAIAGADVQEFSVLVWAGDVEARNNQTLEIAKSWGAGIHIPGWALKQFT
jgi:uncharacterized protein YjbI with pentapeptide repeats